VLNHSNDRSPKKQTERSAFYLSCHTLGFYYEKSIFIDSLIHDFWRFDRVLDQEKVIPIMFTSMFRIGEETGELSEMITKLADFYEDEVSDSVKALTSIMEPMMIVFVAVFVGIILIAMYLPMFSMMQTVG